MLSKQDNERLTRVGAGTPAGEMFRRYWQPICPSEQLAANPVVPVRILGEDLVLYRDRSGTMGLIDERCPHRGTSLSLGIPEGNGLRCCYHGWLFDHGGRCLETPLEAAGSNLKHNIRIKAYPVEDMGGLIWAYLGPVPAPVLPRWDIYVRPEGFRQIIGHHIPTNWLQVTENQADPGHIPYGHGRFFQYALEREGRLSDDPRTYYNAAFAGAAKLLANNQHMEFRAIPNQFGYTVGRKTSDEATDAASWNHGTGALLFPAMLTSGPGDVGTRVRRWCQVVVPVDDYTTWQFQYFSYFFPKGVDVPTQSSVPYTEIAVRKPDGGPILDYALGQDIAIFQGQGAIADRTHEHLGSVDAIVIAYRKLLRQQIEAVEAGNDPINVFRNQADAESPDLRIPGNEVLLPSRGTSKMILEDFHKPAVGGRLMIDDVVDRYNRDRDLIVAMYKRAEEIMTASESAT